MLSIVDDPDRVSALAALSILDTPAETGFDDAVRLAARLCATPVALVSLVAADRQWFKARVGFPRCETDLSSSVCAHALAEPDLLVIPDLSVDPRTVTNPLVTGEPFIRFYAGAPLRLADGQVVGSLCVIDTMPRPAGLTPEQADDLRALGRQVSDLLELRRSLERERQLGEVLRRNEARTRSLFATIDAGYCVLQVRFEQNEGAPRAVDYRFLEVNPAFERQTGLIDVSGRWMRELAPDHEQHWFDVYGRVALTGEPARFENGAAALGRWYDVHAIRIGEPHERHVAVIFNDITARRSAEVALQASESRFRALVTAGAQSIYSMSPDWQEMRGLDGAGFLADTSTPSVRWLDLYIDPADRPGVVAAIEDAIRRKGNFELEHRVRRANGGFGWTLSRAVPIFDEHGEILEWFGAATDVSDRRAAQDALKAGEAYWRGLFERLQEGLIIGKVERDASGRVVDWRYLEVNPAWSKLTGLPSESAVGRTLREVLPEIEDEWVDEPGYVVDTGEAVAFTRRVDQLARWFEGRVSKLGDDTFILLFLDVTERVAVERGLVASAHRKAALAQLGDHLRTTMSADAMGYTVGAIVGKTLGASQAAYATVDALRETVHIETSWHTPGATGLKGSYRLRDYGSFIDDLRDGRTVVITDACKDDRTHGHSEAFSVLGVSGLINVPVVEHGVLVALVLALFAEPRVVTREEEDFVRAAADRTRAGIARIRADERQAIVNGEISHRLKNTLAMVQAIANQTLKGASDREAVHAFDQRLLALSTAHDVLLQKDWDAADLGEVVRRVLDAAGVATRCNADGPTTALGPRAALSTSLLLHELATNATKYGALTRAGGRIEVRWKYQGGDAAEELILNWREVGGPPAVEPIRKGFGSRLLKMGLVGTGGSTLRYGPDGLEATFRAPRIHLEQS